MIRTWFAVGMMFSFVSAIEAQEVNPPVVPKPAPRAPLFAPRVVDVDAGENGEAQYMIEFKVLEGKGLFNWDKDDGPWRDLTPGNSAGEVLRKSADGPWEKATTAGAAPQPAQPSAGNQAVSNAKPAPPPGMSVPVSPGGYAFQPEGKDEFWLDAPLDSLGITTVTAPRITLFTKQSATIQMQTSPQLSYLAPLGDGKYQAKSILAKDLGMKITLEVQGVDGDDAFVEVSPLEIEITALDGREPVEGLNLDVGKPIISTRSLKTTAKMKLGATRLIAIPSGPKTQAALLVRVKRANVRFDTTPLERKLNGVLESKEK